MEKQLDYYNHPAISNSALSLFNYDIGLFHKTYITKELKSRSSDSMIFGSFVHMLLGEPEKIEEYSIINNIVEPSGKMLDYIKALAEQDEIDHERAYIKSTYSKVSATKAKLDFESNKNYQDYYEYLIKIKSGQKIISSEEYTLAEQLTNIVKSLPQWDILCPINGLYKTEIFCEQEFFWHSDKYNLDLKSKLDRIYINHTTKHIKYCDYKTDSKNPLYKYKESFEYWKTYRQMAFYNMCLMNWANENNMADYHIDLYVIPIDIKNKTSTFMQISDEYLIKGEDEITKDLEDLSWHLENNKWDLTKNQYNQLELQPTIILKP